MWSGNMQKNLLDLEISTGTGAILREIEPRDWSFEDFEKNKLN